MLCKLRGKKPLLKNKPAFLAQVLSRRKKVFCKKKKCVGIRLLPVLIVLSVFTISLAIGAYARRNRISEEDRFSVEFWALVEAMKR